MGCGRKIVITDSNVDALYGDRFVRELEDCGERVERIVVAAGERAKTIETYAELVRGLAALEVTREEELIALGGGTVSDLVGFAAATYMRGIAWSVYSTTLLGMVDASVGGKTGVDLPEGKNLIGAFNLPRKVVRRIEFLETLPQIEMMNGYAEMIKMAVLFDAGLIGMIRNDLGAAIERCVELKERIVAEDFTERGRRKLLNLGHTFGHAIEQASGYRVPHGIAVAIGLRKVSRSIPEIGHILDGFGFSEKLPVGITKEQVIGAIRNDKKRIGDRITMVVPKCVGECELREVALSEVEKWW